MPIPKGYSLRKELESMDFWKQTIENPTSQTRPCVTCGAGQVCRIIAKDFHVPWSAMYFHCKGEIGYFANYWREFT